MHVVILTIQSVSHCNDLFVFIISNSTGLCWQCVSAISCTICHLDLNSSLDVLQHKQNSNDKFSYCVVCCGDNVDAFSGREDNGREDKIITIGLLMLGLKLPASI